MRNGLLGLVLVGLLFLGARAQVALSEGDGCPTPASGAVGVETWADAHCGGSCSDYVTTCNGQFTIELTGHSTSGDFVTFTYEVCQVAGQNALSHWVLGLAQLDCLDPGVDLAALVVDATLNGEAVPYVVGLDPTTQVTGVKFDEGVGKNTCNTFAVTLDRSLLAEGYTLCPEGCALAVTKAGNQDIRPPQGNAPTRASPGYVCVAGPSCCPEDDGEETCETAFAHGDDLATCFLEDGFDRWGWTNGLLEDEESQVTWDLWAAAGQCDLSKGARVGTVTVTRDGQGGLTVTYALVGGYTLQEAHVYVGADAYPFKNGVPTVAPGQFPLKAALDGASGHTFTLTDVEGDVHVIAHAVVCGDFDAD